MVCIGTLDLNRAHHKSSTHDQTRGTACLPRTRRLKTVGRGRRRPHVPSSKPTMRKSKPPNRRSNLPPSTRRGDHQHRFSGEPRHAEKRSAVDEGLSMAASSARQPQNGNFVAYHTTTTQKSHKSAKKRRDFPAITPAASLVRRRIRTRYTPASPRTRARSGPFAPSRGPRSRQIPAGARLPSRANGGSGAESSATGRTEGRSMIRR
jgi:hypothetical protein